MTKPQVFFFFAKRGALCSPLDCFFFWHLAFFSLKDLSPVQNWLWSRLSSYFPWNVRPQWKNLKFFTSGYFGKFRNLPKLKSFSLRKKIRLNRLLQAIIKNQIFPESLLASSCPNQAGLYLLLKQIPKSLPVFCSKKINGRQVSFTHYSNLLEGPRKKKAMEKTQVRSGNCVVIVDPHARADSRAQTMQNYMNLKKSKSIPLCIWFYQNAFLRAKEKKWKMVHEKIQSFTNWRLLRQTKSKFSIYIYLYQNPTKDGVAFSGFGITFFHVVSVEFGKVC